jgi:hypothetical protein
MSFSFRGLVQKSATLLLYDDHFYCYMWQTFDVTVNVGVTKEAEKVTFVAKESVVDGQRKRNLDFDSSSVESE